MSKGLIRGADSVSANLLDQLNELKQRISELERLLLTQDKANLLYEPLVGGGSLQVPNVVYAGPASAPDATPAFRPLVEADIPAEIARDTELHSPVSLNAAAAALLDLSGQTIGLDTQSANQVFAGPSSGGGVPVFRSLVDADIPNTLTLTTITLTDDLRTAKGIAVGYTGANPNDDAVEFYNGSTKVGDIGSADPDWLRINQNTSKDIYTPRLFRADGGLATGSMVPGVNNLGYTGNLRSYKSGVYRNHYAYVQNNTVNDTRPNQYTAGEQYITLRGVGGVPATAVGAYVTVLFNPATVGTALRLWSWTGSNWTGIDYNHQNQTGYWRSVSGVCFFDGSGRIRVSISHTLSQDVNIYMSAYLI